jgi:predicted Zn-dependent protease
MKRIRVLVAFLVCFLLLASAAPAWAAQRPTASPQPTQAERDRKKSDERETRDAREDEKTLDENQEAIDHLALSLLEARYDDPFLQEYVNELGQSLVPTETPEGILFSFRVIRSREPNALALPDGRIFVTTGLLTFINNEAQLAFVLGHEIGHVVERHFAEAIREAKTRAKVGALVGAGVGALLGGLTKGKEGAAGGALAGAAAGLAVASVTMNSYSRQQEDEADRLGLMLALDRRFDVKEADPFFQKLAKTFGERDKFSNSLWGRHSRNLERIENINRLLAGDLTGRYNTLRTQGELTLGSSQMYIYTSAMIRDTAIDFMETDDRYDLAKGLLEQIATIRARDPKTLWALGKVYKTVGRTEADRSKALDLLQQGVRLDERNRYPFIRRDYGLMQARLGNTAEAVESLKGYVLNQIQLTSAYPEDIEKMYDYLLIFGDSRWTAPRIDSMIVKVENAMPPAAAAAPATTVPAPAAKSPSNVLRPTQPARPAPPRTKP